MVEGAGCALALAGCGVSGACAGGAGARATGASPEAAEVASVSNTTRSDPTATMSPG